jgi:hypothetical protein
MIAIAVMLLAVLAAGALVAAMYWSTLAPGEDAATASPAAASAPPPPAALPTVPLMNVAVNVYDASGAKRTAVPVGGKVELARNEQFVQFVLAPKVSGYVYMLDDAKGTLQTQLTAQPSAKDNIRSNELVASREVLFPGTGKAIQVTEPRQFAVVFSSVRLDSPGFFSGPSNTVLDPAESAEWREFLASAHACVPDAQPNQRAAVVFGPASKDAGRATVFQISFTVK